MIRATIEKVIQFVTEQMNSVENSHGLQHVERVVTHAKRIAQCEGGDLFIIEAGAWLHDILDEKLFDPTIQKQSLIQFLQSQGISEEQINVLLALIQTVSFGGDMDTDRVLTKEQKVVRDADRLDAIGAIGIARNFHYGGHKNLEIFNANILPQQYASKAEYRNSTAPTVNHFYEKLLSLKDKMETVEGRRLAQERHDFMLLFLKQFFTEVEFVGYSS